MAKRPKGMLTKAQLAACPVYIGRCPHCNKVSASMVVTPGEEKRAGRDVGKWIGYGLLVEHVKDKAAWRAEIERDGWCAGDCQAEPDEVQPDLFAERMARP